ncbi:hypothetical protein CXF80_16845 [Shewanella sp. Actino-trap-3]|jgi:hypothetical protein|uniref:hypothetical protein n=1 Tax=Shewanella sp. Actino-trap-3 TaxID=2058331 RepID=UPI000C342FD5|nr:hypothetical protein [Shewanella sp. Actino-trap-3]PKG79842.1 hypothetical protein CXF80_16845 [Shewanella sp. Actino-trap-3]
MNSLERELGIEQIDRMLPFLRYDHYGMHFWCLPDALNYNNAVEIGTDMGARYSHFVQRYPNISLQLSDILLAMNLKHENNIGYLIGFAYSIDRELRQCDRLVS